MSVKKLLPILCIFAFLASGYTSTYDTKAKIKAVFLYNFTKYIEWPKEYRERNFVFGIMGDSPLYTELSNMAKTKKVLGKPIVVKKITSVDQIPSCHILYVTPDNTSKWSSVLAKTGNKSTLLVSESPGYAKKGATINFLVKDSRQKFELNKSNAEKHQLKISSSLEALAILVN